MGIVQWYIFWSTDHILFLNIKYSYSTNKMFNEKWYIKNIKRFPDQRFAFMVGMRGVFMQQYLHLGSLYRYMSLPIHISKGTVIWVLQYL